MTKDVFVFPAAVAQERMWFLDQLEPGDPTYNIPGAVRFLGFLDVTALGASLREIVKRHESLRTTFEAVDGKVMQIISPDAEVDLQVIDASSATGEDAQSKYLDLICAISGEPFDLVKGPLLRVALLELAPDDHVLLIIVHHIVADGWSMMVLIRELAEVYQAVVSGRQFALPALSVQYADYAHWQRKWLSSGSMEKAISYWKQKLANASSLDLPIDYNQPPVRRRIGSKASLELSQSLSEALTRLGRREQATLFMVLLSAFKVLLHRYTGAKDIVVGAPVAGRKRVELQGLIGCFLNTVALRAEIREDSTFIEALRQVKEVALDAYSHDDAPFEMVLAEIGPQRDLRNTPLFRVFFNMLNFPEPFRIELPGLSAELVEIPEVRPKFDITLYVKEKNERITLALVYDAGLFTAERIAETLRQYESLLKQIIERPDQRIDSFSLVTESARSVLPNPLIELDPKWEGAVHELFDAQAQRTPDNLAVIDPYIDWSYRKLEKLSNQLANYLLSESVRIGDVIAIYGHRSAPLAPALLGALKAGAAFVILDPAYPPARLIDCLSLARPKAWLQMEAAGPLPEAVDEFLTSLSCPRFLVPSSSRDDFEACFDGLPSAAPNVAVGPESLAYISFTSGSTGKPKGVLGKHGSLTHFLPWFVEIFSFNPKDRFSLFSALSHDPLHRDLFTPLMIGAAVCIPDGENWKLPGKAADWIWENEITVSHLTPAMGQLLGDSTTDRNRPLDSLRRIFFYGDALTRDGASAIQKLAPRATVVNYYGATETQRAVSFFIIPSHPFPEADPGSAPLPQNKEVTPLGRGIKDVQLLVLNRKKQLCGIGEVGEIYFRSPHLALGYLDDPKLSNEKFIASWFTNKEGDRLYKTGDIGRYLPSGVVETLGRDDTQVKIRGFRIELEEIEAVLRRHRLVRASVVVAQNDNEGNRRLVAYIVLNERQAKWEQDLFRFIAERLPNYMAPAAFVSLQELPLTPNGKIDRHALPAASFSAAKRAAEFRRQNGEEEILSGIFTEVLQQQINGNEEFFQLGGHSLQATQVVSRIRSAFEVELPLRALFEAPTVVGLAERVRKARGAGRMTAPRIKKADRRQAVPLSYAQQRLWLLDQIEPGSSAYNILYGLRLEGDLNKAALQRSVDEIVRRHEILRTRILLLDEAPVQEIAELRVKVEEIDLRRIPQTEREAESQRLAQEEAKESFDLARGPLLRVKLLELAEQEYVLLLSMHHIVSDAWSMGIMIWEFRQLYEAYSRGEEAPLEKLNLQYADFAVWQRKWLKGAALDEQLKYWRKQLSGAEASEAPPDKPRPKYASQRGARENFELGQELTQKLKALSQREGVTLFMTLVGAFQLTLKRYTGNQDIVIGTDTAGRSLLELEGLVGFFVNQLVLRTDLSGSPSFHELLRRVRKTVLEAYDHQDVPFDKLVEELAPKRDIGLTPLFQIKLVLQNAPRDGLVLPGLVVSEFKIPETAPKFDILLNLTEIGGSLLGSNSYNPDLFSPATIKGLLHFYRATLTVVAEETEILDAPHEKLIRSIEHKAHSLMSPSSPQTISKAIPRRRGHVIFTG